MTKLKLFLGYVHPEFVPHHFMECMFAQLKDGGFDTVVQPSGSGPLIAQARNLLVEKFLESSCDYFLSLDTDIEWQPHQVEELMAHDKDIVSGLYRSRGPKGEYFPVYLKLADDGFYDRAPWSDVEDATELMAVPGLGMGFCLIKRKVMEALGTAVLWPYAETVNDLGGYMGEDITFCFRAREKGFETFLDPTVRVGHSKFALL